MLRDSDRQKRSQGRFFCLHHGNWWAAGEDVAPVEVNGVNADFGNCTGAPAILPVGDGETGAVVD